MGQTQKKKNELKDAFEVRMSHTSAFPQSTLLRLKCAEVLFSGNCLCRHGLHMFDRCLGSAASHPSAPPRLQDSAADVRKKVMHCLGSFREPGHTLTANTPRQA